VINPAREIKLTISTAIKAEKNAPSIVERSLNGLR